MTETEEHTKKTWLEEEIENSVLVKGEDIRAVAKAVCRKILKELHSYNDNHAYRCESTIRSIIEDLGVEV